eukprot:COSAG02_NODE_39785_length_413_cov_0.560510_2_plen_25_part_01
MPATLQEFATVAVHACEFAFRSDWK